MTFEKQILARIERQNIRPTPRGYFALRTAIIWSIVALSVITLGIGFGMIIFMLKSNDIPLLSKLGFSTTTKIISSIPFFWIILTMIVGGVAYINFRSTRKGYKMSSKKFAIIAIGIGLAVGSIAYVLNVTRYLDEAASENIPIYNVIVPINTRTWFDPDHGLISGTVKDRDSNESFRLRVMDGELWDIFGKNINIPAGYSFHPGDRVKIVGTKTATTTFQATDIYPWKD